MMAKVQQEAEVELKAQAEAKAQAQAEAEAEATAKAAAAAETVTHAATTTGIYACVGWVSIAFIHRAGADPVPRLGNAFLLACLHSLRGGKRNLIAIHVRGFRTDRFLYVFRLALHFSSLSFSFLPTLPPMVQLSKFAVCPV